MAFCKYCGTQLQEGELCNCEKAVAARTVVEPAPAPAPEAAQAAPEAAQAAPEGAAAQPAQDILNQGKEVALGVFNKLLALWKKPAEESKAFVQTGKTSDAIIILVLEAVLAAFFAMAQVGKVVGTYIDEMKQSLGGLGSMMEQQFNIEIPYGDIFFYALLIIAGIEVIFLVAYIVANAILKLNVKADQWLRVVSLRGVAAIPFTAAAILVTFINQGWGLLLFLAASFFVFAILMLGTNAVENLGESKSAYLVAIVNIVVVIVVSIIANSILGDFIDALTKELGSLFSFF